MNPDSSKKKLLLIGAGLTHLRLIKKLVTKPLAGINISLLSTHDTVGWAHRLPAFVSSNLPLESCRFSLLNLRQAANIEHISHLPINLNINTRQLQLKSGEYLSFDALSYNTGTEANKVETEDTLPGAREFALFCEPFEDFAKLWPQVLSMGEGQSLRITLIGASRLGIELALAIRERLPKCAITLLTGKKGLASNWSPKAIALISKHMATNKIILLPDQALAIHRSEIILTSSARLACDIPVITFTSPTPYWIRPLCLNFDPDGEPILLKNVVLKDQPIIFAPQDNYVNAATVLMDELSKLLTNSPALLHEKNHLNKQWLRLGPDNAMSTRLGKAYQGRWIAWLKNREEQKLENDLTST